MPPPPTIPDASDDEEEEGKKGARRGNRATELTSAQQEHLTFGKFGDSLLTKSAKLAELMSSIEAEMANEELPAGHKSRAKKCIAALEGAVAALEKEAENVHVVKAQTSKLESKDLDAAMKKTLLAKLEEQMTKAKVACCKVVTAENAAKSCLKSLKTALS